MSDGITEMNKSQGKWTHPDGTVYGMVQEEGETASCYGCCFVRDDINCSAGVNGEIIPCQEHDVIFKIISPPATASAALAEKGTPLVANMKEYDTGATRGGGKKPSHIAYNSPLADLCFGDYMLKHETQEDGVERSAGNWKLGMPINDYLESLERHVIDMRMIVDGFDARDNATMKDTLCAIRFNTNGAMDAIIRKELK